MGREAQKKRGDLLKKRREKIWQELQPFLGPMHYPKELFPKIRPWQDGAHEILRIEAIHKSFMPFYLEVSFVFLWANTGEQRIWHVRFNTGMIVVVMIADKILLKREFKLPIGKWTKEIPRCFANLHDVDETSDHSLAIISAVMKGENLADFFIDQSKLEAVVKIHEGVYENTGTDAVKSPVYLVKINGQENPNRAKKGKLITWSLHDLAEVKSMVEDLHSMAALFSLEGHLQKM